MGRRLGTILLHSREGSTLFMADPSFPSAKSKLKLDIAPSPSMVRKSEQFGRRAILGAFVLVALSFSLLDGAEAGDPLVVIVNKSNRDDPTRVDLAAVFTTRKQTWSNGERTVPFNFPAKHPVRVRFDELALNMSADEVASYWIDRKIRGGNPPPKQVSNGRLIVRVVAKLPGAVGYVPRSLVDDSVRVVLEL